MIVESEKGRRVRRASLYVGLSFFTVVMLFPLAWMLSISFRDPRSAATTLIPAAEELTLESYQWVLFGSTFPIAMRNSFIVSITTVVIGVGISLFAGYALARMSFFLRRTFGISVIVTQMVPTILLAVPWYVLLVRVQLNNTFTGLTLTYLTLVLPFGIWMLYGYFSSVPIELEEAAFVDGCSRFGVVWRIILPVSAPGIATVALFSFVLAWEEFLYALMIMSSDSRITVTVGAARLISSQIIYFGYLGAYGTLSILPVLGVFLLLQRHLIGGLTAGAVK